MLRDSIASILEEREEREERRETGREEGEIITDALVMLEVPASTYL